MPSSAWHALLRDHVPAYITWETYQRHLDQLAANRNYAEQSGVARQGAGLLSGLLACGQCGRRLTIRYQGARFSYSCSRNISDYGGESCMNCAGKPLDAWVERQLLEALSPASLTLSLETMHHLETERETLRKHWQLRLERAEYEVKRAERQYQAVEPENRLVARSLERAWETALQAQRDLREEFERYEHQSPRALNADEVAQIQALAQDLPALWQATTTTVSERKEILRLVIERIIVQAAGHTEQVNLEIHWFGGQITSGMIIRPVARLSQLSYYPMLIETVREGVQNEKTAEQVAEEFNTLGYRPAKRVDTWTAAMVRRLAADLGLIFPRASDGRRVVKAVHSPDGEWWTLSSLAVTLGMPSVTLYRWLSVGEVQAQRRSGSRHWWVWADQTELQRLKEKRGTPLHEQAHRQWRQRSNDLGTLDRQDGGGDVQA